MNNFAFVKLTIIGIITGIFGGVVGAGAEILIVPLLTIFGVYSSLKTRVGTSLVMLLPPIGIFATIRYFKNDYVDLYGGLYMATLFTFFSYFSAKYSIDVVDNKDFKNTLLSIQSNQQKQQGPITRSAAKSVKKQLFTQ